MSGVPVLWITYSVKSARYHPTDGEPDTYYNVGVFDDEMQALRHSNSHGGRVIPIMANQTLEDSIKADRPAR